MQAKSMQSQMTLVERIDGLIHDSNDILVKLTKMQPDSSRPIEIVAELPAAISPDIIIGTVQRWREIQKHFNCELRVYAWSYNPDVEKYVMKCVQPMDRVLVTPLPTSLKGDTLYV